MSEKIYGIDMGTNSIKIYQKESGVVFHQKNMIAIVNKKEALAIGDEAYSMYEKAPKNIQVKQPIVYGVIADFTAMQTMIEIIFRGGRRARGVMSGVEPLVVNSNSEFYIAVPSDVTEVEKRAFYDLIASSALRTKKVHLVDKPIADALGAVGEYQRAARTDFSAVDHHAAVKLNAKFHEVVIVFFKEGAVEGDISQIVIVPIAHKGHEQRTPADVQCGQRVAIAERPLQPDVVGEVQLLELVTFTLKEFQHGVFGKIQSGQLTAGAVQPQQLGTPGDVQCFNGVPAAEQVLQVHVL